MPFSLAPKIFETLNFQLCSHVIYLSKSPVVCWIYEKGHLYCLLLSVEITDEYSSCQGLYIISATTSESHQGSHQNSFLCDLHNFTATV